MSLLAVLWDQSVRASVLVYPLGIWVVLAVVAVVNGGFRELVLIPQIGEYAGHILSTIVLVLAIVGISFVYFRSTSIGYTRAELLLAGMLWMGLTIGFEFAVGYVEGTPFSVTIGQYNVLAGQIWVVVPITLLFSPLVFGWYLAV